MPSALRMSKLVTAALLCVFVLLLWTAAPAQAPPQNPSSPAKNQQPASGQRQTDDPQYRIRVNTELVVVPVTVKDSSGRLVSDIRADEFRIFEDEVEQKVEVFAADPFPLSVVVLVDNDLPTRASESVQKTLATLSAGFSEFDEVALMLFDEVPKKVLEFTSDNAKLLDYLKRTSVDASFPGMGSVPMTAGPRINGKPQETGVQPRVTSRGQSVKHLDDAVYAAADLLRSRGRDRRKIVYLVSDGVNAPNNTNSRDDTLKLLLSNDISVYAIGVGTTPGGRAFNALSSYAKATGGDVLYANTRGELETLYSRVTEQARYRYTLAYAPRGTDRKRDYHTIEVRVRRPNLAILTREGYYSAPTP